MSVKEYINQPFPVNDHALKNIVFISLFIPAFLILFQPFNMDVFHNKYKTLILLGFGVVTFVIALFNNYILPLLFKKTFAESNWTVGKNMLSMLYTIFTIGLGNYIYTCLVFDFIPFNFLGVLEFQFATLMVAIIPVGLINTLRFNSLMAKNLQMAREMNLKLPGQKKETPNQTILFTAENEKDFFEVAVVDFLYVESNGNYLAVNYIDSGKLKTSSMRSTLKRAEVSLAAVPSIAKCHRAFYVNLNKITNVKGNSQGYRLCLELADKEIPVARNYAKTIKELLSPPIK